MTDILKSASVVAKMGDVFCDSKKDRNEWKKRMLLATGKPFHFPEDWDELSEDEKEKRLNKVIEIGIDIKAEGDE